jgi:hypothetical protein
MVSIKILPAKSMISSFLIMVLSLISPLSFANINNQTPLTTLHGDPAALNQELQPLEKYQPLAFEHTKRITDDSLAKLNAIISQLVQITDYERNYEIIAYSLGGIILFEYLKSITIENLTHSTSPVATAPSPNNLK